jgi:hypothetical protein
MAQNTGSEGLDVDVIDESALLVEDETATASGSAVRRGRAGRGLGWNEAECLALCHAASVVCQSPILGAEMRQAELGRRLRAEFLRDPGRPPDSGTQTGTGGDLDIRRWEGRLAGACLKQYQKIKAECCGFYAASKRIEAMELTGSPGEEQLSRCALAIYNCGSKLISHVYDIINNPNYIIGKEFPYQLCYDWLRRYTSLLECGDNTGFKIRYQADAMNNVKTAEKRDEDLEN